MGQTLYGWYSEHQYSLSFDGLMKNEEWNTILHNYTQPNQFITLVPHSRIIY